MNPVRMQFIHQKLLEVQQDANAELEMEDVGILDAGGLLSEVRSLRHTQIIEVLGFPLRETL